MYIIDQSPGRDSPGDDSSASIGTVESSSVSSGGVGPGVHHGSNFGGCRNSTTSLDSGRASNTNSAATNSNDGTVNSYQLSTFHTIHPIQEHTAMVNVHPPQVPSALMPKRLFSQNSTDSTHGNKYIYYCFDLFLNDLYFSSVKLFRSELIR